MLFFCVALILPPIIFNHATHLLIMPPMFQFLNALIIPAISFNRDTHNFKTFYHATQLFIMPPRTGCIYFIQ